MTGPANYRAFLLDNNDHIVKRYEFEAATDDAALDVARQYVDGHDVEVWHRERFIRLLRHDKKSQ